MDMPRTASRMMPRRSSGASVFAAILAAAALVVTAGEVTATNLSDFSVVPATGGTNIAPATAGGVWTTLAGPAIDVAVYSNPDVFPPGLTFTLALPANFEWNAAVTTAPVVSVAAGMPAGFCSLIPSPLRYGVTGAGARTASFTLSGTHDVGCVVSLRGLRVRPVSADPRAGTGGNLVVDWEAPGLGASRAAGGVISLAPAAPSSLPPTDIVAGPGNGATSEHGMSPVLLGAVVMLGVLLGVALGRGRTGVSVR